MLNQARAAAMLPAQDLERAKAFYRDKLGLTPTQESPGAIFYALASGTGFVVFPSSGQSSGTYTQLALEVQDFDRTVKDLRSKGVKFEEYDTPMLKTVDGVAEAGPGMKIAWLKDSEGNLIAVAPPVPVAAAKGA
jgi:catechol 2,3-dioxygenase-like lactoylglutathione lyase family enzyme